MFNKYIKKFQYGNKEVTLETGEIARQANSSVKISMGDTVVLVTVVVNKEIKEGQDFFPLTVDYFERSYSAGKIPGGFIKREGRQSEKEILTSRLIDRPIRPLFPENFYHDIQVVAMVLSSDPEIDADIIAMLGASAALILAGVPFNGPVGAAKVGYLNNEYILNPSKKQLEESKLDLIIAGTKTAVLMVESEAKELSEDIMLNAIAYGHEQMQVAIKAINEFADKINPIVWDWQESTSDNTLIKKINDLVGEEIKDAFKISKKQSRTEKLNSLWLEVEKNLINEDSNTLEINKIKNIFKSIEAGIVRNKILSGERRIDGRDTKTVRPIDITINVLPKRVHGSVLFTRGETQALVTTTLGTSKDEQFVDALSGEYADYFMLHYNFPPYSTGEIGRIGTPKRREIGHGKLAKRSLLAILPDKENFDYSIRVVSEITESNGSSSMASVCGGCLSMLSAGVPLKKHVAGIAMGLILENNKFAILTDILGDEDHLGDMDFKVAGTEDGITALQMDIKIQGITKEIMQVALYQAKEGRLHILDLMKKAIEKPEKISNFAPRIYSIKVNPDKIRDIIGKGGETIRSIIKETNTEINIEDNGLVVISSNNEENINLAKEKIELIIAEVEIGKIYEGTVVKILDNNVGAIVSILPGKDGLVHVSQIAKERVNNVNDYLKINQKIKVKVLDIDNKGRVKLSIKETLDD